MTTDPLSTAYADYLIGTYDCPDRIVLNAYVDGLAVPGGFRNWWRLTFGDDSDLDKNHIIRFSGRCSRRVNAYCRKNDIPLLFCKKDDRQHEFAEVHLPKDPGFIGLFCITVKKAPAPVWKCNTTKNGYLDLKKEIAYVNQYAFHIIDHEWGHITFKLNPHPPFSLQISLNGHEFVECSARKKGITHRKEDNCFTDSSNLAGLSRIAETMNAQGVVGRLVKVCERWIYTTCLCFALPREFMQISHLHYSYSVYQVEYSRNLLFHHGAELEQIFQSLVDRTRGVIDLERIKTIFGNKRRPYSLRNAHTKKKRFEITVEKPVYDLTIFKIHFKKITVKIYSKGARVLRTEAIAHNVTALRVGGRTIERFPDIVKELREILIRFLGVVQSIDHCYISHGTLQGLSRPGKVGTARVGGIQIEQARMLAVFSGVLKQAMQPRGFTVCQIADEVKAILGRKAPRYRAQTASYDIRKLRAKKLVQKIKGTKRYQCSFRGLKTMAAMITLQEKVIKPLITNIGKAKKSRKPGALTETDKAYDMMRQGCLNLFAAQGIAV